MFCSKGNLLMTAKCCQAQDDKFDVEGGLTPQNLTEFMCELSKSFLGERELDMLVRAMTSAASDIPGDMEARHLWLPFLRELVTSGLKSYQYSKLFVTIFKECAVKIVGRQPPSTPDDLDRRELIGQDKEELQMNIELRRAYEFLAHPGEKVARFRWTSIQRGAAKHLWRRTRVKLTLDESTIPPVLTVEKISRSDPEQQESWVKKRDEAVLRGELSGFPRIKMVQELARLQGEDWDALTKLKFLERQPSLAVAMPPVPSPMTVTTASDLVNDAHHVPRPGLAIGCPSSASTLSWETGAHANLPTRQDTSARPAQPQRSSAPVLNEIPANSSSLNGTVVQSDLNSTKKNGTNTAAQSPPPSGPPMTQSNVAPSRAAAPSVGQRYVRRLDAFTATINDETQVLTSHYSSDLLN